MPFGIASFRSRQQVFAFEAALSRAGIRTQVVSTPREVALGCGTFCALCAGGLAACRRCVPAQPSSQPHWVLPRSTKQGARPEITAMPVM